MSAITVTEVQKSFKGVPALKRVSLSVNDGEFCVLLGASGCGKTTLLRIVAGLETADQGVVQIGDRNVTALPPRARNIAMVFQNYAVFPHMTIAENIGFGLQMKKAAAGEIQKQVQRMASLMHIDHLLDRYAGQLSGGQRQRVAVARALATQPDVLLMDEPLSNLDALLRLEMRSELKGLLQELGTTTLYVTHDQVEAMSLGDRIAVMNGGVIEQYEAPQRVYDYPATAFVGSFIGNPPMNFVKSPAQWHALGVAPIANAVTLGIRPEDLTLESAGLAAHVRVIEMLGAQQQITLRVDEALLRVNLAPNTPVQIGSTLQLRAKAERCRWYDAVGKRID
jgi:multiple sugar transport system ATP-binding protein